MLKTLTIALMLTAAPAALFAEGSATPAASGTEAPKNLPAISVIAVGKAQLTDAVVASGLIGAVETVYVQPQIEGQAIDEVLVDVGDTVTAGQLLARLSETSFTLQKSQLDASAASVKAQIAQAEAQILDAKNAESEASKQWARTETLLAQGTVSETAADQVKAALDSARVRVTVAEQGLIAAQAQLNVVAAQTDDINLRLERTNIIAPVAGKMTAKSAVVGQIASAAGQPLFVIARDGRLELSADIAEVDILKLQPGQLATLTIVGSAQPLTGSVRLVEPTLDRATRLGRVRISIDDSTAVREGMFAEADIIIAAREGLAIPVSAIGGTNQQAQVFVVRDGQVVLTDVKTGIRDGGLIEITAGLTEGDLVVAKAGAFVRDGDRINPILAASAAPAN